MRPSAGLAGASASTARTVSTVFALSRLWPWLLARGEGQPFSEILSFSPRDSRAELLNDGEWTPSGRLDYFPKPGESAFADEIGDLLGRHRSSEQKALNLVAAEFGEQGFLFRRLHTFTDDFKLQRLT